MANSVDPDQTAPIGAVCSGSTLFASILNLSVMLYMVHTNGECRALNQRAKRRHFCLLFQKYHDLLSNVTL